MAEIRYDAQNRFKLNDFAFGCNLEHTRGCLAGGLSAQILRNRKFAGKPDRYYGVAAEWFPINGEHACYDKDEWQPERFTRHIGAPDMDVVRKNERGSQYVQCMDKGVACGIGQKGLYLKQGEEYEFRLTIKSLAPVEITARLTDEGDTKEYATEKLSFAAGEWQTLSCVVTSCETDANACLRLTFTENTFVMFGAVSLLPKDNFHGMRPDVVQALKDIGVSLLRWPGGNFAGEYRWKDGLLPVDERAPLQSYMEIETQPYTHGYDFHEIDTDDFIALCREVGAEPALTINAVWSTPEENAQWVEYCNGDETTEYGKIRAQRGHKEPYNVRYWSLGNEMGYGHMEGPKGPKGYAEIAAKHLDAMKKVSPNLEFVSSGPYPSDEWVRDSVIPLKDDVKHVSLHVYLNYPLRFYNAESTKDTYAGMMAQVEFLRGKIREMRASLPEDVHISFDEWNFWGAWYRPSCVAEGMFAARVLHLLLYETRTSDLSLCCFFQPVGEGCMKITPEKCVLTADGQAFNFIKCHKGGEMCPVENGDDLSVAVSKHGEKTVMTIINADHAETKTYTGKAEGNVLEAALLTSEDVRPHTHFAEKPLACEVKNGEFAVTLPPHSIAKIIFG